MLSYSKIDDVYCLLGFPLSLLRLSPAAGCLIPAILRLRLGRRNVCALALAGRQDWPLFKVVRSSFNCVGHQTMTGSPSHYHCSAGWQTCVRATHHREGYCIRMHKRIERALDHICSHTHFSANTGNSHTSYMVYTWHPIKLVPGSLFTTFRSSSVARPLAFGVGVDWLVGGSRLAIRSTSPISCCYRRILSTGDT